MQTKTIRCIARTADVRKMPSLLGRFEAFQNLQSNCLIGVGLSDGLKKSELHYFVVTTSFLEPILKYFFPLTMDAEVRCGNMHWRQDILNSDSACRF